MINKDDRRSYMIVIPDRDLFIPENLISPYVPAYCQLATTDHWHWLLSYFVARFPADYQLATNG